MNSIGRWKRLAGNIDLVVMMAIGLCACGDHWKEEVLDVTSELREMPNIVGMGNVGSLWQVMAQEARDGNHALKDLIEQFGAEADPIARQALTVQIIYAWTRVTDKDPASRANWM
ncbi:hypothetical protein [Propionivibrio dicarboxylicus]|uniref:Uncharacterized protein n=1 Tax=Propionivibrio dicarboxylicus TaxID=83767 RepID=A0A1G8GU13_9RHOO|nr:hypothetical protein [Propionivibrio dicarboxylicus]SDH97887.1 hypothetical protein SAMN05660652_02637 [Propionivibrio dicarboxylicus]